MTIVYAGALSTQLSVQEGRLGISISRENGERWRRLSLPWPVSGDRSGDYFAICECYYQAIRKASAAEIENHRTWPGGVCMIRAELLVDAAGGKIRRRLQEPRGDSSH